MTYYSIENFYRMLGPSGLQKNKSEVTPKPIRDQIQDALLDPRGMYQTYDDIKKNIGTLLTSNKNDEAVKKAKKELKQEIHAIGHDAQQGHIDFDDKDYWNVSVMGADKKEKQTQIQFLTEFVQPLTAGEANDPEFKASMFIVRNPYITPAKRGVEPISFFLNNTPPIVASQMMPYLDVEIELRRPSLPIEQMTMSTPTMMRFLLGSVDVKNMPTNDAKLEMMGIAPPGKPPAKGQVESVSVFSGMELFLSPQTLTNMDGVYSMERRTAKQRPFVPFASIEGFDVSVQNAGAGKFAHRKGSLKLKIHDKSRLSEIADFLRPQGYHQALIWTTYGWLAPMNRGDEDEYCDFINDNMLVKECWSVVNTQYSFDTAGQVQLTIELLTRGGHAMQKLQLVGDPGLATSLGQLRSAIEAVQNFIQKNSGNPKFSVSPMATQVMNAAANAGSFEGMDVGQVQKAISNISESLKNSSINQDQVQKFTQSLNQIQQSSFRANIKTTVNSRFRALSLTPDPLVPTDNKPDYWDEYIVGSVKQFSETLSLRKKAAAERLQGKQGDEKKKLQDLAALEEGLTSVVSFGKLFMNFVAPAVKASRDCDELQVVFYTLNDSCGPVSGYSIAEFPIDIVPLVHAYAETLKVLMTDTMSIETFLKLIIETQFTDQRAIGYGMSKFFKPLDPDKPRGVAEQIDAGVNKKGAGKGADVAAEAAEKGLAQWASQWGSWRPPMIEMVVETGIDGQIPTKIVQNLKLGTLLTQQMESTEYPHKNKIIRRIHIYDKQNNPHKLAQAIISAGREGQTDPSSFTFGAVNKAKLAARSSKFVESLTVEKMQQVKESLQKDPNLVSAVTGAGDALDVVDRPIGPRIDIKTTPYNVKKEIKRFTPTLDVGTNGTMILSANAASKSDGVQGAINIMRSAKGFASGKPTVSGDGLSNFNGLPLTILPMQLNMTTMGVPTLQLYQAFFIDFDTGTSIDNVYTCTQIQHNIAPGKFNSSLTFMYTDGYPKFGNPPEVNAIVTGQLIYDLNRALEAADKKKKGGGSQSGKGK